MTEHHLEVPSLKEAAQARLSLRLSKCHIVGNLMSRLNYNILIKDVNSLCQRSPTNEIHKVISSANYNLYFSIAM